MNSLVVFLSMVALAAAKPSGNLAFGTLAAYSAPILAAAPSAVSQQSRIDIKSSPAIVETAAIAPIASRTIIAEPAISALAPVASRTILAQPTLLAGPALVGSAAVSSQSRIDIKSTPGITETVIGSAPLAYTAPFATAAIAPSLLKTAVVGSGITTAAVAPAYLKTLTPTIAIPTPTIKSAAFVPGVIGAPAVTLNAAGIAVSSVGQFATGKELNAFHLLKKRSAPIIATPALSYASVSPLVSTYGVDPLIYSAPVNVVNPVITKTYGVHSW